VGAPFLLDSENDATMFLKMTDKVMKAIQARLLEMRDGPKART
jgi:hypothetical protein